MLGMMNSPSDSVEFYAVNRKISEDIGTNESLEKFSEIKTKDTITYTEDGRKMINGKVVDIKDAPNMWGSTLLRRQIQGIKVHSENDGKKQDQHKKSEQSKVVITEEAIVGTQTPKTTPPASPPKVSKNQNN